MGETGTVRALYKAYTVHMKAFTVKSFPLLYAFEMLLDKVL